MTAIGIAFIVASIVWGIASLFKAHTDYRVSMTRLYMFHEREFERIRYKQALAEEYETARLRWLIDKSPDDFVDWRWWR